MKDIRTIILGVLIVLTVAAGLLTAVSYMRESKEGKAVLVTEAENGTETASAGSENKEGTEAPEVPDTSERETEGKGEMTTESESGMTTESKGEMTTESESGMTTEPDTEQESERETQQTTVSETTEPESETVSENEATSGQEASAIIAIDAGHQGKGNYEKEPIGPGASETKAKVSSGTQGAATKVAEYELTLAVSLKLKEEFLARGYEVVMIRETHDVNLSNKERAEIANEAGADVFLRIHADGSENSSASGASTLYPSEKNPYVSYLSSASKLLSQEVVNHLCEETGARNRGAIARDDMSGINWCEVPVTIVEMGFMTNPEEDKKMQTEEYQNKIVKGICDGVEAYLKAAAENGQE